MIKKAVVVVIALLLTISFFIGCAENKSWGDAPDFSLKTLKGENIKLSDFLGSVIIIDLMGVDCPFCVEMMPVLKTISENYDDIVIISVDVYLYETEYYLQSFIDAFKEQLDMDLDWVFGMDSDGGIAEDYIGYGEGVPKIVIIDENGNIYYEFKGYTEYSKLKNKLDEII